MSEAMNQADATRSQERLPVAIAALRAALPADIVITDPDLLATHQRDECDFVTADLPAVAVRARDTEDVRRVLAIASEHHVPVVPQGALTGLAGAANAIADGIALSLRGMNRILRIDPVNRYAVVQPGVINKRISEAVAEHGLRYPPDPGSWESSTIGGNVSTNAGGMCCVKYGVTTEYVLGLEIVLADGEVLRTGRRTAKGVAGYDLTSLFTGSEGTLGVITEITLGLRPATETPLTLAAVFGDTASAGAAVTNIMSAGCSPSLLEIIDQVFLRAIDAYRPMGLPVDAAALLLASVDTGNPADLQTIADLAREAGATEVHVASDAREADMLLESRRLAHPAMEKLGPTAVDDIAVPRSRLAEFLDGTTRIASEYDVTVAVCGHAGDGNMHPNILLHRDDEEAFEREKEAFDAIMRLGLEMGGTITGEHGVGTLKRDWLATEIGPVGLRVHAAIKAALDPTGILNPGKVFTPTTDGRSNNP